jgi:hypothetical protein
MERTLRKGGDTRNRALPSEKNVGCTAFAAPLRPEPGQIQFKPLMKADGRYETTPLNVGPPLAGVPFFE